MRVTNKLMTDTVTSDLLKKANLLLKAENAVSSGKKITKPSDDPLGTAKVLDYRKTIASIEQYGKNIDHAESWLNLTESTLADLDILLVGAKETAVSQATGTATEQSREIAAKDIQNAIEYAIQLANTTLGNSHIFAGHLTDAAPFDSSGAYSGDTGDLQIVAGENVEIDYNVNGEEVFNSTVDIFQVLTDLKTGLENNDSTEITSQIDLLDSALDQVLKVRGEVGTTLNRLESTENYWSNFRQSIQEMLTETEEIDLTKAITDLSALEASFQASLAASSSILQSPSLVDFFK